MIDWVFGRWWELVSQLAQARIELLAVGMGEPKKVEL
jgi:hypothetical protein